MGIERRLGSASNILKDFAENQATTFGLSKKQVAEYGNIYSVFMSDFETDVNRNAELTKQMLAAAGTIASATGYDIEYVLQGLRSGIMGSTAAIDQFGLSVKASKLEPAAIETYGAAWDQLTASQQRQLIVQEILNQTTTNYGGIVKNSASMLAAYNAQVANTKMALGNVGKYCPV